MRYVVNYVAGYGEHGRYYCTIKDGETPEAAGDAVIAEKMGPPFKFDWVQVESVETVEEYHAPKVGECNEML
jgi:hypothetical protein